MRITQGSLKLTPNALTPATYSDFIWPELAVTSCGEVLNAAPVIVMGYQI